MRLKNNFLRPHAAGQQRLASETMLKKKLVRPHAAGQQRRASETRFKKNVCMDHGLDDFDARVRNDFQNKFLRPNASQKKGVKKEASVSTRGWIAATRASQDSKIRVCVQIGLD